MNKKIFFARAASKALALAAAVMMMSAAFTACSKDNDATKHNTGKYVDLGLPSGLKWAKCNLGASKPSDYGDYYAWGEIEPKTTDYSWVTYKWGTESNMTKYNNTDSKTTLEAADDAATAKLGSPWRMPTNDEIQELIDKCTWTWTTQDGVKGYEVKGPNGNSIFLPVAGNRTGSRLDHAGVYGYYRSSSLSTGNSNKARGLYFNSSKRGLDIFGRCYGFTVRPVCP